MLQELLSSYSAFSTNFAFSRWRASVADEPSPRDRKETDPEVAATAQQLSGLSVNGQVNEATSLNHQDEEHAHESKQASSRDELAADLVEKSAKQIVEPFMQHGHQQTTFYTPKIGRAHDRTPATNEKLVFS